MAGRGFKKRAPRTGGNISFIPKDGIVVQFLTDTDEWLAFFEYWNGDSYTVVANESDAPAEVSTSIRYLASALDVKQNRVIAIKLPYTLAESIATIADKYHAKREWDLTDYTLELSKEGSGMNTTYNVLFEEKADIDLGQYTLPDLEAIVAEAASPKSNEASVDDIDNDEDEEPQPTKKRIGLKKG